MFQRSVASRLLAIGLSAMMALPSCLTKANGSSFSKTGSTKDGVPVVLQKTVSPTGEEGYLYLMPVPGEQENETLRALAAHSPETTTVAVESENDPAYRELKRLPGGNKVSLIAIKDAAKIPLMQMKQLSKDLKLKLQEKVKAVTEFCQAKDTKEGVLIGFITSSVLGGFTFYSSQSIEAGLVVLASTFLWNTFLMTRSKDWAKVLLGAGEKLSSGINKVLSLFGKSLTDKGHHFAEVGGQFSISWVVNTAIAALVLWGSDQLYSVWQAGFFGLLLNYNIWDPPFQKKVRDGVLGPDFMKRYFKWQAIIGVIIETGSYLNFPPAQLLLFSISTLGLIYASYNDPIDTLVGPKFQATKLWVDGKVPAQDTPLWRRLPKAVGVGCADLLKSGVNKVFPPHVPRVIHYPPDDIQ